MHPGEIRQVGPYPVSRFIAEGGMAWVFEVVDTRFDARRALKLLKPEAARGEQFRRFQAEARLLAQIDHPNLVTLYDFGKDEETECFYYTMTLVDGPTLSEVGVLSATEAGPIFLQVLSALVSLHRGGIVHRDIKPGNVLINSDGRAMLGDLGVARFDDQDNDITQTGDAIGTVLYMSPEQARGQAVGPASDVFAMGLSLYRVLCGKSVYEDVEEIDQSSGVEVLLYLGAMIHRRGEFHLSFPPEVPGPIRKVITKACRMNVEDRYPDAESMREALQAAIARIEGRASGASSSLSVRTIAIAVAVIAAVVAGGLFATRSLERSGVADDVAELTHLESVAADLLKHAGSLQPPLPPELLIQARDELDLANSFFTRAKLDAQKRDFEAAIATLRLARAGFDRACEGIGEAHFAPQAEAASRNLTNRVEVLRAVRAGEVRPDRWQTLEELVSEVTQPVAADSTCTVAQALLDKTERAEEATELALNLEQVMQAEWPKLAEAARTDAKQARGLSRMARVAAPEYTRVLDRGQDAFRGAERLAAEGSFLEAHQAFLRAEEAYREAERIAPAALARAKATMIEPELAQARTTGSAGGEGLDVVTRILAEAEDFYLEASWEKAAKSYNQAISLFENVSRNAERLRQVAPIAQAAEAIRSEAVRMGAERTRSNTLAEADALLEAATTALEEGQHARAKSQFELASQAYTEVRDAAAKAYGDATAAADAARKLAADLPRGCELFSPSARVICTRGTESFALGEAGLQGGDVASALGHFVAATDSFERARGTEKTYRSERDRARAASRIVHASDDVRARVVAEGGNESASGPIATGDRHRLSGLGDFEKGRYEQAGTHFESARQAYSSALAAARAALEEARIARREAESSANALTSRTGCEDLQGGALDECRRARTDFEQGDIAMSEARPGEARARFEAAQAGFARAASARARQLQDLERSEVVAQAAASTRGVRSDAVAAGAEASARPQLAQADELAAAAKRFADAMEHDAALTRYGEASAAYAAARDAATTSLAAATAEGEAVRDQARALEKRGGCDALGDSAEAACTSALVVLSGADAALAAQNAAEASAGYRDASAGLAHTIELQQQYLAALPRPPVVTARQPESNAVDAFRNQQVNLAVSASDPNGDPLTFRWSANGAPVGSSDPKLTLRPSDSTRVVVQISDGHGGSQTESWDISVRNRRPKLSLSPANKRSLEVGQRLTFRAKASDPDGDSVDTEFSLDGTPIGDGETFEFRAEKPGTYVVSARATDAGGASVNLERTVTVRPVQVAAVSPPKPTPRPASRPPTPDTKAPTAAKPPAVDPVVQARKAAFATLVEYEAAYEAQDIDRLSKVWLMNTRQHNAMRTFFSAMDDVALTIERKDVTVSSDKVTIDFDQQVRARGLNPTTAALTATLVRRGSDKWAISSIGPRQ